jgi:ABC-2 type transport system ATP-binding protein
MTTPVLALRINKLSKQFGNNNVLRDISLDITAGEFFGLVGINGAGKTTLIKCILDFCEPDSGIVEIFGISNRTPRSRSGLIFLPERFSPPHYLTGQEFINYMLTLQNLPYVPQQVAGVLRALDFDENLLTFSVSNYSKGMSQKLGLASCLLANKNLSVLDEPTTGLDPKARALFKAQLHSLKEQNKTLLLTSHSLADVQEICDRMAILHNGGIAFLGTPLELIRQYSTENLEQAFLACIDQSSRLAAPDVAR